MHDLDCLIDRLESSREIYEKIIAHYQDFKARAEVIQFHKARDFRPTDPLGEWLDVTDEPLFQIITLEQQGMVARIRIQKRWYARPGIIT